MRAPSASPGERLRIDGVELESRREFFEIADDDLRRLSALRPFAEESTHEIVEDRFRIGIAHERVGVPPKWYLGAYARYMRAIFRRLSRRLSDPAAVEQAFLSASKLVAFDMALAMDTYIAAQLDTIAQHHQAAIRELSTPVIRIHDRVLLLPLVGVIDAERATQMMESVLLKVVEEHALVMIIDIAGVPVVNNEVAQHLIRTSEAVRLLGARTILCGISPTVATALASLPVNLSSMDTRNQLAEGLERAYELIGMRVVAIGEARTPRAGADRAC